MAYIEKMAGRVREIIIKTHTKIEEKSIFGGLCFMVNHKMCGSRIPASNSKRHKYMNVDCMAAA